MADFEFYGDASDCDAVATAVLTGSSYVLIPNLCYEGPTPIEIRQVNAEFATYLNINKSMFIVGAFTQGLSWQRLSTGRWEGHYVIRPEHDGPLFSVRFPAVSDRGDVETYSVGVVSRLVRAYAPKLGIEVPLSHEAKTAFSDVVARVKSVCCRTDTVAGRAWVGRGLKSRASRVDPPRLIVNGVAVPLLAA